MAAVGRVPGYVGPANGRSWATAVHEDGAAMKFHVLTIFPEFFRGPFEHGVIQRAREAGLIEIRVHDLRDWTHDRHRTVDDRPFGGGEGMLLKAEPIFEAVESILPERGQGRKVILLSAQGRKF